MEDAKRQIEELAGSLRETLSPQEKMVFDFHWDKGPQDNDECRKYIETVFEPSEKGTATSAARGTKEKLDRYFESKLGIASEFRVSLGAVKGRKQRAIKVRRNVLPRSTAFWLGHLLDDRNPRLVLSEQNEMSFLPAGQKSDRDWHMRLGLRPAEPIETVDERPQRAVRLADVQATLTVHSFLKSWSDKKLGYLPPKVVGSSEVTVPTADNLVLIGTSRDWDGLIETRWAYFPMLINDRNVTERFSQGEGYPHLIGPEANESGRPLECCAVLVSRATNKATGLCVTLINGSHPAAVEGVCELLVDDARIEREILLPLKLPKVDLGFPDYFQILFVVTLTPDEMRSDRIKACQFGTLEPRSEHDYDGGGASKLRSAVNLFLQETAPLGKH